MKHTKKNIALALTIGLTAMNLGFADSLIADSSAIKPISCTTSGCNTAKDHDDMNACDNCNSLTSENKRDMKQIYTYPESVYGTNNKVGNNHHNSVATSYNDAFLRESKGVPLAEKGSNITGAAANMPVVGTNNIDELNTGLDFGSPRIKIETPSSQQILMRSFKPVYHDNMTGAAAPLRSFFPDVSNSFWASEQINRLANEDIAQGYPSGLFKPNSQISRAEMASEVSFLNSTGLSFVNQT